MIGSTVRQSSLFYVPLASQISLLKDDLLEPVGSLLDDPELVDMVRKRLAARRSNSTRTGRPGIAPDRLLRCCVLKHLKGCPFGSSNASSGPTSCAGASPASLPTRYRT